MENYKAVAKNTLPSEIFMFYGLLSINMYVFKIRYNYFLKMYVLAQIEICQLEV